ARGPAVSRRHAHRRRPAAVIAVEPWRYDHAPKALARSRCCHARLVAASGRRPGSTQGLQRRESIGRRDPGQRPGDHEQRNDPLQRDRIGRAHLPGRQADLLNVPNNQNGYLIKSVVKGSPAEDWGLRGGTTFATVGGEQVVLGGDIVLAVDGLQAGSVANMVKIKDQMSVAKSGAPLKLTI